MTHNIKSDSVAPRSWISLYRRLHNHYNHHHKHSAGQVHHILTHATAGSVLPAASSPDAALARNTFQIDGYNEQQRLINVNADLRSQIYNARVELDHVQGRIEDLESDLSSIRQTISKADKNKPVLYAVEPVGKPDPVDNTEETQAENKTVVKQPQQVIIQIGNSIDLFC